MTAVLVLLADLPCDADGRQHGTADQLAAVLSSPERTITAGMVRKWAWRSRRPGDPLRGVLPAHAGPGPRTGTTWYLLLDAARAEAATRR